MDSSATIAEVTCIMFKNVRGSRIVLSTPVKLRSITSSLIAAACLWSNVARARWTPSLHCKRFLRGLHSAYAEWARSANLLPTMKLQAHSLVLPFEHKKPRHVHFVMFSFLL
eukprot:gb/GEZN01021916.1/.p1 GENE.gb/GEZN01021916.1/~~gb/GEZN01021916.1/.p1  ORF type:complete len:112 (-),score=3.07 gb/GEZN01021916.1/:142-477(-)